MLSTVVGITNAFFWHRRWTFKSTGHPIHEFVKFSSVYLVSFFLNVPLLALFVEKLKFSPYIGQAFVLGILAISQFLGHKFWSFRTHE